MVVNRTVGRPGLRRTFWNRTRVGDLVEDQAAEDGAVGEHDLVELPGRVGRGRRVRQEHEDGGQAAETDGGHRGLGADNGARLPL